MMSLPYPYFCFTFIVMALIGCGGNAQTQVESKGTASTSNVPEYSEATLDEDESEGTELGTYQTEPHWPDLPILEFELRPGNEYSAHQGPDFETHQFRNPEDTGVMTIYLGGHPSYTANGTSSEVNGITWYTEEKEYGYFSEALPESILRSDRENLCLHVFIHAKTREALNEFQGAAATLREQ